MKISFEMDMTSLVPIFIGAAAPAPVLLRPRPLDGSCSGYPDCLATPPPLYKAFRQRVNHRFLNRLYRKRGGCLAVGLCRLPLQEMKWKELGEVIDKNWKE